MTGFGVGESPLGSGRVTLEARSVNHRFLDVRVRMPREMTEHGVFVEQLVRARLSRGRVEITVHTESPELDGLVLDRARAVECLRAFDVLAQELGRAEKAPLSLLSCVPELFTPPRHPRPEAVREALDAAIGRALAELEQMRAREGAHLAQDLTGRLEVVRGHIARVVVLIPRMTERHKARFRERVERLLDGVGQRLNDHRIEQELAMLTEHMDVAEELTRLQSHCEAFGAMVLNPDPVGRRMDFLLQEMAREVNTLGSKASDAEVAQRVVELKVEVERMREQVQNIE